MNNVLRVPTMKELTPIEKKVFDILSDGRSHSIPELMTCLEPYSSVVAMQVHISNIRKKLRSSSYDIKCDISNRSTATYRLVQNLVSPYDGKQ